MASAAVLPAQSEGLPLPTQPKSSGCASAVGDLHVGSTFSLYKKVLSPRSSAADASASERRAPAASTPAAAREAAREEAPAHATPSAAQTSSALMY